MKAQCKQQRGVAKELGISTSSLHDILRKGQLPSLIVARRIHNYTEGDIEVDDWLDELPIEKKMAYGLIKQLPEKNHTINKVKADKTEKKIKK